MSYTLSRLMSTATAAYAGYCFVEPGHLGNAVGADKHSQPGYDQLALVFGVRDAAISTFGVLGRSDKTVGTAMLVRIACDFGDGVVLAAFAPSDEARMKVLGATFGWGALNLVALATDKKRATRAAAARKIADATSSALSSVTDKVR